MESRENSKYDELMMRILCEEQSIPDFLNIVFGFLYRRTDLFVEQTAVGQKFGYPAGQTEILIYDSVKYFQSKARKRNQLGEDMQIFDQVVENEEVVVDTEETSSTIVEAVGDSSGECFGAPLSQDRSTNTLPVSVESQFEQQVSIGNAETSECCSTVPEAAERHAPVFVKRAPCSVSGNCYNGAARDRYAWSQTITDLEVEVQVSASVLKSSQVSVSITSSNINVLVDGAEPLSGALARNVKQDETVWTLTPGKYIQIHLEKVKECWWDRLIESEPKISLQQIDSTRPFSELPQEEQMKVNELIWNDYQKSRGQPTSQQIKSAKVLQKAWNAEGSPFKGRPFDPSIISDQ